MATDIINHICLNRRNPPPYFCPQCAVELEVFILTEHFLKNGILSVFCVTLVINCKDCVIIFFFIKMWVIDCIVLLACEMRQKFGKNKSNGELKTKHEKKVTLSAQCCQMATTIISR